MQNLDPFAGNLGCCTDAPVTLPPGRARLATSPEPTGSTAIANAIGMVEVACFTAWIAVSTVRMTSTLRRTNSAAISAARSLPASRQRTRLMGRI
jgi:hypothetical protein